MAKFVGDLVGGLVGGVIAPFKKPDTPDPRPLPAPAKKTDTVDAAKKVRRRAKARRGRVSTILTGDGGKAPTTKKKLLGG